MARTITLQRWQPDGRPDVSRPRLDLVPGKPPSPAEIGRIGPECPEAFRKQLVESLSRIMVREGWISLPGDELPRLPPTARLVVAAFARGDLDGHHAWCVTVEPDSDARPDAQQPDYLMAFFRGRSTQLPAPGGSKRRFSLEVRGIPGFLLPALTVQARGPLGYSNRSSHLVTAVDERARTLTADADTGRVDGPMLEFSLELVLGGRRTRLLPAGQSDVLWVGPLWRFRSMNWKGAEAPMGLHNNKIIQRRRELEDVVGSLSLRFGDRFPAVVARSQGLELWITEKLPARSNKDRLQAARAPLARLGLQVRGDALIPRVAPSMRQDLKRLFDNVEAFFISPVVPLSLGRGLLLPTGEGTEMSGSPRLRVVIPAAARASEARVEELLVDGVPQSLEEALPLSVDAGLVILRVKIPSREPPSRVLGHVELADGDATREIKLLLEGEPQEVDDGFLLTLRVSEPLIALRDFAGPPPTIEVTPVLSYTFSSSVVQDTALAGIRVVPLPSVLEIEPGHRTRLTLSRPVDREFAAQLRLELRERPDLGLSPTDVIGGFEVEGTRDLRITTPTSTSADTPLYARARWGDYLLP